MLGRQTRGLVGHLTAVVVLGMLLVGTISIPGSALAQDEESDLPTEGRLGGTLQEIQERFGPTDWTDTGLIGYNSQILGDVDTIVVVYYDEDETIYEISLVYLEQPVELGENGAIAEVVADVAPEDGECGALPLEESGLGTEVYGCQSESLEGIYSAEELTSLGVKGDEGAYSYSVNPNDDDYYEVILQFGTDSDVPVPTPVPTEPPAPTPTPSLEDEYPPVADVRELAIGRGFVEGDPLSVAGVVQTIFVDGDLTQVQISVAAPDGSDEWVVILFEGDSTGLFEGSWLTAYGLYFGTSCFTNALGGEICQPLVISDTIVY